MDLPTQLVRLRVRARLALVALLLLFSGVAFANSPFFFDFNADPTGGGATTSFTDGDFDFDVTSAGSGENLNYTTTLGDVAPGLANRGIVFNSGSDNQALKEIMEITLSLGGNFIWDAIWVHIPVIGPDPLDPRQGIIVSGLLGGSVEFSQNVFGPDPAAPIATQVLVNAGGITVDRVRIETFDTAVDGTPGFPVANDIFMAFDNFSGEIINDLPLPGAAALLMIGLLGMRKRLLRAA